MLYAMSDVLFSIGDFDVTISMLIYTAIILIIIIALLSYRWNHRMQTKVAGYMDNETDLFNKRGLDKFFKRKHKKFSNPTLVVVEIRNLQYLYTNYLKRNLLMSKISDELVKGLSKKETAGRIEFNKFLLVLDNKNRDQIKEICHKIEERFDNIILPEYGKYNYYLYYGIYEKAPINTDKELILIASNIVKYSNITDENRYYYCLEVKEALDRLKRMNQEKDYDFAQKRFVPYIQPKVDLKTGKVVGGEILVRWVDESQNFKYPPGEFIPLFESNGFVTKIDEEMFRQACKLAKTLVDRGKTDIVISVNISKIKFMSTNFEQSLMEIIAEYQVSPKNIEIEITETTVMENFQYVSNCIMTLRQLGFNVAMDDFGKEFSSLGSLSTNPFDTIKLDMVFFRNKLATEKDRLIVRNILDMLSKLNYEKVCEGISDKHTLDMLATINQDVIIQGYVISQPIPVSQFEAFANTTFEFNYPPVVDPYAKPAPKTEPESEVVVDVIPPKGVETQAGGGSNTSINISGLGSNVPAPPSTINEIDEMRRQMIEMERKFQTQLEEQRRQAQEDEIKRMRDEMNKLRETKETRYEGHDEIEALKREMAYLRENPRRSESNPEIDALRREIELLRVQNAMIRPQGQPQCQEYGRSSEEIYRLRREIDDLRYERDRDRNRDRNDNFEQLHREIQELKENQKAQPQFNVEELIARLSQTQIDNSRYQLDKAREESQTLRQKLERERKEKEELENLLNELQFTPEISEEEVLKEQEEADKKLNLDLSTLSNSDFTESDTEEEEEDEEETEVLEKPNLSLEEIEAIVKSYQDKYMEQWNSRAKEELKDGYYEVVNGLKYYKGNIKKTFIDKIKRASPEVKQLFNIIKNELMKYTGTVTKITNSYDCIYIGRKQIAKLSMTSSKVKVFLAADPTKYPERQFPHKDLSAKKVHSRTPYYTMVKSQLSVRRVNKVIADVMSELGISENPNYKPIDFATKYKFYKSNQK